MPALVIGLGNHGDRYQATRHNLGWRCLAILEKKGHFSRSRREGLAHIRQGSIEGYDVVLAWPHTYMNLSGNAGAHLSKRFNVDPRDVIVVHDDLDLPVGRLRVRRGGSSAGQRGVASLIESWQTADFVRVRIGIGRPPDDVDPVDYVLHQPTDVELPIIKTSVQRAADAVVMIIREGLEPAMNTFNRAADG